MGNDALAKIVSRAVVSKMVSITKMTRNSKIEKLSANKSPISRPISNEFLSEDWAATNERPKQRRQVAAKNKARKPEIPRLGCSKVAKARNRPKCGEPKVKIEEKGKKRKRGFSRISRFHPVEVIQILGTADDLHFRLFVN